MNRFSRYCLFFFAVSPVIREEVPFLWTDEVWVPPISSTMAPLNAVTQTGLFTEPAAPTTGANLQELALTAENVASSPLSVRVIPLVSPFSPIQTTQATPEATAEEMESEADIMAFIAGHTEAAEKETEAEMRGFISAHVTGEDTASTAAKAAASKTLQVPAPERTVPIYTAAPAVATAPAVSAEDIRKLDHDVRDIVVHRLPERVLLRWKGKLAITESSDVSGNHNALIKMSTSPLITPYR